MSGVIGTIGHSTRSLTELIELLTEFGTTILVDIRTVPRSRHNPQFNRDVLPASLAGAGIEYLHEPGLGGLRKPRPDSPNGAWRNSSFRGFADHMQTAEFERSLERLIDLSNRERIVLMCAESVPWRCHRSLIADALTARGLEVLHLIGPRSSRAHTLTPWARVEAGHVSYPDVLG